MASSMLVKSNEICTVGFMAIYYASATAERGHLTALLRGATLFVFYVFFSWFVVKVCWLALRWKNCLLSVAGKG